MKTHHRTDLDSLVTGPALCCRSDVGGCQRLRQRGQSLMEFALVLPFLSLLLFSVIDLGFVFLQTAALNDAAREGARAGSMRKSVSDINAIVKQYATWLPLKDTDIVVTVTKKDGNPCDSETRDTGSRIQVVVSHDLIWLTPMAGFINPSWSNKVFAKSVFYCQAFQ